MFWHGVFATGNTKVGNPRTILKQVAMFRRYGLGSFRNLLLQLSKNPAMMFFLDNKDSHKDAVNENYGRELLELFSMGVGNYTEDDVRQASLAFTGWTIRNASMMTARSQQDLVPPYGPLDWHFQYMDDDHDDGVKAFLGHEGAFNGEDIIDIICKQPATARFISRHMYNFFVADEPQVPAWETVPPRDPEAIDTLAKAFVENDYEIRPVLRVLLNSDFFKDARYAKVKSPTELVVGTARMAGGHDLPELADVDLALLPATMGQELLDPPSVEGWHTGMEWITTGIGATFHIELPILYPTDDPGAALEEQRDTPPFDINVLVVNDEAGIRDLYTEALQEERYAVDTAINGDAAWSMVQGKSYDCVLLDLKMPGLNGRQLYDLIHGFNQEMASRVIFVTGDVLNPHVKDLVLRLGIPY